MMVWFIFYPNINLTDLIHTPSVRSNLGNFTRLVIGRGDACQATRGVILGIIPLVMSFQLENCTSYFITCISHSQ